MDYETASQALREAFGASESRHDGDTAEARWLVNGWEVWLDKREGAVTLSVQREGRTGRTVWLAGTPDPTCELMTLPEALDVVRGVIAG